MLWCEPLELRSGSVARRAVGGARAMPRPGSAGGAPVQRSSAARPHIPTDRKGARVRAQMPHAANIRISNELNTDSLFTP